MRKWLLVLLGLFTFANAAQTALLFAFEDIQTQDKKQYVYDLTKALLIDEGKINETPTEYKTLGKKEEDEELNHERVCLLYPALWLKEDVEIAHPKKRIILKNVPITFSTFLYHAAHR